jgi:membrane protease YdiL (CAAX protease family)
MQAVREAALVFDRNSVAAIRARAAEGKVPWAGPLLLLAGRGAMWMASLGIVALIFRARGIAHPWRQATYWWSVCFTLSDMFCLAAMRYFTRREGMRLRDLIGPIRMRHGRDIFLGLGYYVLIFPFFLAAGYLTQILFYGPRGVAPNAYILHAHALPLWAVIYSLSIYWIIQSATEELTYQGFALPRLEALTGRPFVAFAMVAFFFTAQHCALGFVPDWRANLCRFLAYLPGCAVVMLIYMRTRRLAPLIVAHWLIDIGAIVWTAF